MPTNHLASESSPAGVPLRFGAPSPGDGESMWRLAQEVGLDLNSPYAYVLWGEYFATTSLVAHSGDDLVGFVSGFRPPHEPDSLFVWQIGVAPAARRTGLGGRMLDSLIERVGATRMVATVTPDNLASAALFRAVGTRHHAPVVEELAFSAALFPDGHEAEVRFTIGPLGDINQPSITR